jgi:hypothetical protein
MFTCITWGKPTGVRKRGQMRGTDSSLRIALMVHGHHRKNGLSILRACELVAETTLAAKLGHSKRGRPSGIPGDGVTEVDETVKSLYSDFRKRKPDLDEQLAIWIGIYKRWRAWVKTADTTTIEFVRQKYRKTRNPELGILFYEHAQRIRLHTYLFVFG